MSVMANTAGSTALSPPTGEEVTLRDVQVNLLECKVCFEKFSSQQSERRPQNLHPCGHVLCLDCVRALSHPLLRKLECPFCRRLCDVDATSQCRALTDLQELLLSKYCPRSPVPHRAKAGSGWAGAGALSGPPLGSRALRLRSAFGGWGTLINPTGIAMFGSSGTTVVVHDGERRLVVFGPQGRKLHSFGRRGRGPGEIRYALDVAVTPSGYVVVTDAGDSAVKVFTSRGSHMLTVKDSFQVPWGVDTDIYGHILVSDAQAGSLCQVTVDCARGETLKTKAVLTQLQHPRAVACCRATGHVAVVEHLDGDPPPGQHLQPTRLTVFDKDFLPLCQTDSFSLSLRSNVWLCVSAVAFDREGEQVIVIDSQWGVVWSLGKIPSGLLELVPLVRESLVRPVGLVASQTAPGGGALAILDAGDHAVKTYA